MTSSQGSLLPSFYKLAMRLQAKPLTVLVEESYSSYTGIVLILLQRILSTRKDLLKGLYSIILNTVLTSSVMHFYKINYSAVIFSRVISKLYWQIRNTKSIVHKFAPYRDNENTRVHVDNGHGL